MREKAAMNVCKRNPVVRLERLNIDTSLSFISAASLERKCTPHRSTQVSTIKSGASSGDNEVDKSLSSSKRQNKTQNSKTKDVAGKQVATSSSSNASNHESNFVESSNTSVQTEEVAELDKSSSSRPGSSSEQRDVIVKDDNSPLKTINCAPLRENGVNNTQNHTDVPSSSISKETVNESANQSHSSNVYYDRDSIKLRDVRVVLVDLFPNKFNSKSKRRLTMHIPSKSSSQVSQHLDRESSSISDCSWIKNSEKCVKARLAERKSRQAAIRNERSFKNLAKTSLGVNKRSKKNRVRLLLDKNECTSENQAEISSSDNEGSFKIQTGPIKLFRDHSGNWQIKDFSLGDGAGASWNVNKNQGRISSNTQKNGFKISAGTRNERSLGDQVGTNGYTIQHGLGNQFKRVLKNPCDRTLEWDKDQSAPKPSVYQSGESGTNKQNNGLSYNTLSVLRSFRTPSKTGRRMNDGGFENRAGSNCCTNQRSLDNQAQTSHRLNDFSSGNGNWTSWNGNENQVDTSSNINEEICLETSSDMNECSSESQINRNVNLYSSSNRTESSPEMNDHIGNGDWTSWNVSENQMETYSNMNEDSPEIFVLTSPSMNECLGNGDWTSWNVSENQVETSSNTIENSSEIFVETSASMKECSLGNGAETDQNMNQYILGNPAVTDCGFGNGDWTSWNESENQVETGSNINGNSSEICVETGLDMNECSFESGAETGGNMNPFSLGNRAENSCSLGNGEWTSWNEEENLAETDLIFENSAEIFLETGLENRVRTDKNMNQYSSVNHAETSNRTADPSSTSWNGNEKLPDKFFYCSLCPARFNSSRSLHCHVKTHNVEKPFPCPLCGSAFSQVFRLKEHMANHSDERPHVCTVCSKAFKLKRLLNSHVKRMHSEPVSHVLDPAEKTAEVLRPCTDTGVAAPLQCPETPKHADQETTHAQLLSRQTHECLENREDVRSNVSACSLQNCTNERKSDYQEDVSLSNGGLEILPGASPDTNNVKNLIETRTKSYPCSFCSKTFGSEAYRDSHLKAVHSDERRFFCEFCPTSKTAQDQGQIHRANENFKCPECPDTFWSKEALNRHLRKHSGKDFPLDTSDLQPLESQSRERYSAATSLNMSESILHGSRVTNKGSFSNSGIVNECTVENRGETSSNKNGCGLENSVEISQNMEESIETQFGNSWIANDCVLDNRVPIGVSASESSENNWGNRVGIGATTNDSLKNTARISSQISGCSLEDQAGVISNMGGCFENRGAACLNMEEESLEILAETSPLLNECSLGTGLETSHDVNELGFGSSGLEMGDSFENRPQTSWNTNERIVGNHSGQSWEMNKHRSENEAGICWRTNQSSAESADVISWTIDEHRLNDLAETRSTEESSFQNCQGTSWNIPAEKITEACRKMNEFTLGSLGETSLNNTQNNLENGEPTFCDMNECGLPSNVNASRSIEEGILEYQFGTSWNLNEPDLENIAGSSAAMSGCSFENGVETSWNTSECSLTNNGSTSWNRNNHSLGNPAETSRNANEGGLYRRYSGECSVESQSVSPAVLENPPFRAQQSRVCANEVPCSKDVDPVRFRPPNGVAKKLSCAHCSKQFSARADWMNHTAKHFGERPVTFLQCTLCTKPFVSASALKQHMETHHDEPHYDCEGCSKIFRSEKDLARHLNEEHLDEKPFRCTLCQARFKTDQYLQAHVKRHANKQLFSCTLCPKTFLNSAHLKNHMISHSEERPYSCPLCSKAFKLKAHLNFHVKVTHSCEKPFSCNCCSASFKTVHDMQRHLKTHAGGKGFKCPECPAKFKLEKTLKKHFEKHSAKETGLRDAFSAQSLPSQPVERNWAETSLKTSESSLHDRAGTSWVTNEGSLISNSNMNECTFGNREGASQNTKEVFGANQFDNSWVTNERSLECHVTIGLNVSESSLETQGVNSSSVNEGTFEDMGETVLNINGCGLESQVGTGQNMEGGCVENSLGNTVITSEGGYVTIDLDVNESSQG